MNFTMKQPKVEWLCTAYCFRSDYTECHHASHFRNSEQHKAMSLQKQQEVREGALRCSYMARLRNHS